MLFTSLGSALAVVLCLATAVPVQGQVQAVKGFDAVKDTGIRHVATGTWTRNSGSTANLGTDISYRNDHPPGYFSAGWAGTDEGFLPALGSPLSGPPRRLPH